MESIVRARFSEPDPVITARNLGKTYEFHRQPQGLMGAIRSLFHRELTSVQAVHGLDLEVRRGEIVGLLGPNGAGKTTVVKMLCGLLEPTAGTLSVCGERPSDRSSSFLSRISVIFGQKAMLWWDVSTRESLRIHRSMYGIPSGDFSEAVGSLGELLGITGILDTPVRNLSLGQRMRCELALALLHGPTLLFADEPTIGLDVEAKVVVRNLFREINQTFGTTILLTSHDMNDVEALCDRVIVINAGRMAFDGDLTELRAHADIPREVVLTYRDAPRLPPDVLWASIENGARSVRLRLGNEPFAELVQTATRWGDLLDVRIVEAGLDEVMAKVFGDRGRRP
ncbi:ABC transporter ATP-binding protein [Allostreptomyces psammosilenae]|uniref:ABC-2 type transport system ATP-binding protein n=1 Tax=Allostreptomyces psammosilenae TaxID=1892865 RepID=A0A852ZUC7_9ACTN|nr:ATP-binding cassette domain-containing protein [Allostreptomyces psammosilenae]NYI04374.1 ABC-2 type transport system ATP-binding protein [Allostreptomyces psammosilenae]